MRPEGRRIQVVPPAHVTSTFADKRRRHPRLDGDDPQARLEAADTPTDLTAMATMPGLPTLRPSQVPQSDRRE
jgi:hypothetical protein